MVSFVGMSEVSVTVHRILNQTELFCAGYSLSKPFVFVWGFYAVSTVFQLFNGDSFQTQVSWTISISLPVHWSDTVRPVVVLFQ